MSPSHKGAPSGDHQVSLGEKSRKENQHSGVAIHKAGTESHVEPSGADKSASKVRRQSHTPPLSPQKMGGTKC
jgi:hypothetical protein